MPVPSEGVQLTDESNNKLKPFMITQAGKYRTSNVPSSSSKPTTISYVSSTSTRLLSTSGVSQPSVGAASTASRNLPRQGSYLPKLTDTAKGRPPSGSKHAVAAANNSNNGSQQGRMGSATSSHNNTSGEKALQVSLMRKVGPNPGLAGGASTATQESVSSQKSSKLPPLSKGEHESRLRERDVPGERSGSRMSSKKQYDVAAERGSTLVRSVRQSPAPANNVGSIRHVDEDSEDDSGEENAGALPPRGPSVAKQANGVASNPRQRRRDQRALSANSQSQSQKNSNSNSNSNSDSSNSTGEEDAAAMVDSGNVSLLNSTKRRELTQGGRCGLRNLGNTCFMNSVIQCLSNTRPLLEYVLSGTYKRDLEHISRNSSKQRKSDFIITYCNLMNALWNRKSTSGASDAFSPSEFKRQVERLNRQFMGTSQHDAQELLRYVLQGLHDEINRVVERPSRDASTLKSYEAEYGRASSDPQKADVAWHFYRRFEDSAIVDMFVGQLKSTLDFTECGHKSVTFDPFWDLSLPIPRGTASSEISLDECMRAFVARETLDGDERPKCEVCNQRRRCTKSLSIHRLPRILVIHLKRFSGEHWRSSKVSTVVNFPVNCFDATPYAATPRPKSDKRSQYIYNLYAVSNHSGSMEFGHYVASCRHPFAKSSDPEWNCFDDARVSSIGSASRSLVTSQAYVLFYELQSLKGTDDNS